MITKINWKRISAFFLALAVTLTTCFSNLYLSEKKVYADSASSFQERPHDIFITSKNDHNNEVYEEYSNSDRADYVYFASEGTYNSGSKTRYETVGMKVTWNGCSVYLASDSVTQGGLLHVSKTKDAFGNPPDPGENCYTAYRINYVELINLLSNSFPNGDFSSLKDDHSDKKLKFDSILAVKKFKNNVWNYEGRLTGNGVAYDSQGNLTGIVQGNAAEDEGTWKGIWTAGGNFNNLWNMCLNIKYADQVFPQPEPEPNISLTSYVAVEKQNESTAYTDVNGKLYFRSIDSGGLGQKIHFSIFQDKKRNDGRISKITGQVRKIGSDTNSAFTYDWSIAGGNQNTFFNSVYGGTLNRINSDSDGLNIQSSSLLNNNCYLEVCLNAAFRGAGEYQVQHVIAYTFTNDDKYIIQYSPEANSDKFYVDAVGPTLRINNSEKIPSKLYTATYGGISYDFSAVDKLYTGDYNQSNRGSGVKKITLTSPDSSETTIYENGIYTNNQYKKNINEKVCYQFPEGIAGNYTFTLTDNVGNETKTTVNVVNEKPNINTGNLTITKNTGQDFYYSTEKNNYYIKSGSEVNYSFPVKANGLTITGYALTDDGNLLGTNKLINGITDNDKKNHFYFVTSLSNGSFKGFSCNHIIKSVDNITQNITQNGNGAKGSFKFENIKDNQKVIPNAYAEGLSLDSKNYYYSAGGSATIITDDQAPKIINLADESVKDNTLIAGKTYHFIVKDYTEASYDENGNIVENPEEGSGISDTLTKVDFRGNSTIGNLNNDKTELVFTVPKKNVSNKDHIDIQLTDNVGNKSSYTFSVNKNAMEITDHTLTSATDNIYQPDVTKQNYWVRQDSSVYDNFRANTYFGNDTAFYTDKMSMLVRPVGSSDTTSFSITGIIPKSITDSELKTLDEVTFENNVENYLIKNNASATFLKDNGLSTTTSLNTLSFKNHGDKLELIPKADSDTKTTGWDENKKIEVYVDGKAPEVTEAIKETRVHSEVRTYKFTDADSGVRSFNIYKTMNHTSDPNNVHKLVYTATADEIKNGTLEYEFFDDGNYQIEVVDNVGNIAYPNMIDITKEIYSSNAEITNSDKDYIYFVTTNNNGTDDTSDDEGYYWVGLNKDVNIKMSSETNYSNKFFRPTRNILVFDKTLSNPSITNIYSNPDNKKSAILTSRKEYTTSTDKTTFDLNGKILTTENKVQFLTNGKTYDIQTFARSLYNENDVLAESDYTYIKPLTIKTDGNAPTINTPTQSITNNNINYTFTTEDNQSGLKENSFILYDVNRKIVKTIDKKETSTNSATYHFTKSGYYYLVSEDNVGNKSAKRVHVIDEDNPDPEPPVPPIIVTPPDIEIYLESIKVKSVSFVENANTYKLSDKEFWIKSDTNVVLNEISKTSYFSDIFQPTDHLFNNGSTDGSNILINVTNPNGLTTLNKRINNIENATLGNTSITKKATKDDSTFGTKMEISFNDTLAEYNFIPGAVAKYKGFILAETNYNEQENIDKQLKIHVDGIKPTIANAPVITFKNGKLIYTFSAKDNESGLKNITIVNNNSSKTVANTTTGKAGAALIPEVPYTITATDNVGNVSTMTYMVGAMNIKINTKIDISGTNVYKDGDINWVKSNKNVNLKITSETSYSNKYFYPTKNMYVLANKADKDNLPDIGILTSPFREYTIKNNVYTNNFDKTDKMNTTKITSNYSNNKKTFTTNATAQFKADFEKYVMYPYAESKFDTTIFTKTTYDTNQLITIYTDGIAPIINKVPTQSITSSSIFYTFNTKDNESGLKPTSFILTNSNNKELKRSTQTTGKYQTIKYHFTTKGYYYLTSTDNVGNVATQRIHVIDPDNPEPIDDNDINITIEKVYAESVVMDDPNNVTYKLTDNDYWVKKGEWFALIQTSKSSYVNKYFQVTDNGLNNGVDKLNYLLTKVTNPNGLQTIETEIKDIDTLSFRNQKLLSIPSENNLIFKTRTAISFSDTLAEYKLIPDVSAKYNGNIIARSDYNKNIDKIMKIRVDGIAPIINKVPTQSITSSSIFYTFNTKDNESGLKPTSFILTNSNNKELKRSTQTTEYQTIKYHFTTKGYYYLTSTDNVGNVAKQRIHVIDPDNPEPIDDNDITITLEKVYAESVVMDDPDKVTYKLADNDYWVRRNGWFALVQTSSSSYVSKYFQVTNNTLNNGLSDSSYIMTRVTNPDGLTSIVSEVKNIDTLLLGEPTILSVPNKNNVLFTTRTPMSFSDTLAEYKLIPDVSAKYNGKVIARSDYNENQDKYMKVRIDGINPTTTIISRKNNGDLTANYSFKSVDNESGLKAATLYNETTAIAKGKNGITTYTFNKSGIYSIKATDNVGNVFSTKYNVDLIRPLIYINNTNIIDNNNYTINIKNLKPVIKITDENSGIHTYKIIGIYDNGTEETIYNKTINSEKVLSDTYTLDLENIITKGIHNIKIQATDYQDNKQKGKTNTDDTTTDLIIPIDNPIIRTKYIDTHASYSNTVITTKDYKLFDLTFKILNDPNYQIGKVYQHNYSEIEKYSMQGFSENEFARKGYAPNTKFKWLNIFKNNNLKEIKPNVYEFKLYTTWDKFPKVHTKDIYFSTSEKDTITAEKILAECNATDREDTTTPVSLVYFDANQYKNINENDTTIITETVKTVDSVGNISYGQVNVYVLSAGDGTPDFNSYVRFISPKYYRNVDEYGHFTDYVTKENGGLEENSIWKTEEYKNVLDDAMRNKETNKEKDKIDNIFMKDEKEIDGTGEWDMVNSTYTFTTERIAELRKKIAENKDMFGDNEKTLEFYKDNIELNVE